MVGGQRAALLIHPVSEPFAQIGLAAAGGILQHFLAVVGQRIDGESAEVGMQLRRRDTRIEQNSRVAEFGQKMRSGTLRRKMFGVSSQTLAIPPNSARS